MIGLLNIVPVEMLGIIGGNGNLTQIMQQLGQIFRFIIL
jgi:hypothetical protein